LVFAARALDGLTGGNISVANAYVADLTREDASARSIAFGRMGIAASVGFAIGPAAAGLLGATSWGYSAPIAAAVGISALATVMCLFIREPDARCPEGPPEQPAVTKVMGQQHRRCDRPEPDVHAGRLFAQPIVIALLIATFVQFLSFNLFYAGFPVHATSALGWSAGRMGLFFALMSGTMIVAQGPLLSFVSARLSPSVIFVSGMLGLVIAFIAFALTPWWAPFLGAFLFAVGNGLAWPIFQARVAEAAAPEYQGSVQGAATSAGSLASIVGLIFGGIFYPWFGVGLFISGAALFLLVALGTPIWFRDAR
ncbi:MAG: MFS transporter, partial [Myxococcota bacterium]